MSEEICLAVSDCHPLAVYDVVPFSVIDNEKLVYLSHSVSFQTIMEQLLRAADITPNIAYSCNNSNLFQEMISMNMGISIAAVNNWAHSNPPDNIKLLYFEEHPCRQIYYKKSDSVHADTYKAFEKNLIAHFLHIQNQT